MPPIRIARLILSALLVAGVMMSFFLDWSTNHLLNPEWHPHARFHGAILLFFLAGVSAVSVWMLWRESAEPLLAVDVSAWLIGSFWTPLFYVTSILHGSSAWAGPPGAEPQLAGVIFLPNLAAAAVYVIAALAACRIARIAPAGRSF